MRAEKTSSYNLALLKLVQSFAFEKPLGGLGGFFCKKLLLPYTLKTQVGENAKRCRKTYFTAKQNSLDWCPAVGIFYFRIFYSV